MAGFLPKDYVGVSTRIEKAHESYGEQLSIETEFDIKDSTVIFTARVKIKDSDQIFVGHSFGEVGKEKAFEKLETVAVGRALAFAGFEVKSGIASREEMEVWNKKEKSTKEDDKKPEDHTCNACGEVNTNVIVSNGKFGPFFRCKHCDKNSKPHFIGYTGEKPQKDLSNPPF